MGAGTTRRVRGAQKVAGRRRIIYTTAGWWDTCTGNSTAFSADPLWVAAYASNAPPLPAGWNDWTFCQSTSRAPATATTAPVAQDYSPPDHAPRQPLPGTALSTQ